ncbi:MAG: hypothetical protein KJ606_05840 [Chloroflexi bacterium]|nr:hypothetical protein [Chloroflexota bacterium]
MSWDSVPQAEFEPILAVSGQPAGRFQVNTLAAGDGIPPALIVSGRRTSSAAREDKTCACV